MTDSAILAKLDELTEAIRLWNLGMRDIAEGIERQSMMLADILAAVAVVPDEETPLTRLLRQLVSTSDLHTDQLAAIVASLDRLHQRVSPA